MLSDFGIVVDVENQTKAFISHQPLSFSETIQLLNDINQDEAVWRLGSIAEIQQHQRLLRDILTELSQEKLPTAEVWVSDMLQLETGKLNIPKFYSCDMSLARPRNGSIALKEHKCAALFFCGEFNGE